MALPTLRLGSRGPDVGRLQTLLRDAGVYTGAVDAHFGAETYGAVVVFQGNHGLGMDGVVGPATWNALLGTPVPQNPQPGAPSGSGRGLSIHVGVNRIDAKHYGTAGILHGCENDAQAMQTLAVDRGFEPLLILSERATAEAVLGAIGRAAGALGSGDTLFLTYAGHGSQVPAGEGEGDEDDAMDETWCLYDRMLIDDELYAAWLSFKAGVRVVVLSDSCHSGTISRQLSREAAIVKEVFYSSLAAPQARARGEEGQSLLDSMPMPRTVPAPLPASDAGQWPAASGNGNGAGPVEHQRQAMFAPAQSTGAVTTRALPWPYTAAWMPGGDHYRAYQGRRSVTRGSDSPKATVLAISGCQDNQLSQESGGRGLFSVTLEAVWNRGDFKGDYPGLHRGIVARMPATQTPHYTVVGTPNAAFEGGTPFSVVAAAAPTRTTQQGLVAR